MHDIHRWEEEGGPVEEEELLTPTQVAKMFSVDPKTVTRWARDGKLKFIRTLGGHRRYRRADVDELIQEGSK